MNPLLAVFIGGGLGSLARYGISKWVSGVPIITFPFGTLLSNIISSFILGIFTGLTAIKAEQENSIRFLIAVGFCGGFSTFSTFSAETFELFRNGYMVNGALNIFANLISCLVMIGAGIWIGKSI